MTCTLVTWLDRGRHALTCVRAVQYVPLPKAANIAAAALVQTPWHETADLWKSWLPLVEYFAHALTDATYPWRAPIYGRYRDGDAYQRLEEGWLLRSDWVRQEGYRFAYGATDSECRDLAVSRKDLRAAIKYMKTYPSLVPYNRPIAARRPPQSDRPYSPVAKARKYWIGRFTAAFRGLVNSAHGNMCRVALWVRKRFRRGA